MLGEEFPVGINFTQPLHYVFFILGREVNGIVALVADLNVPYLFPDDWCLYEAVIFLVMKPYRY